MTTSNLRHPNERLSGVQEGSSGLNRSHITRSKLQIITATTQDLTIDN